MKKSATQNFTLAIDPKLLRTARHRQGGTRIVGMIDGEYLFEALLFPEHARDVEWEIGRSRIAQLWLARLADKRTVYQWDRGQERKATSQKTRAIMAYRLRHLARIVYQD